MTHPKGIQGYKEKLSAFIPATESIPFEVLHRDFLTFFPKSEAFILDAGAGIGRDAFLLSQQGHCVYALEPLAAFREAGQARYSSPDLHWINDSLPEMAKLVKGGLRFDFILSSGVWHHLNPKEQLTALQVVSQLLKPGGCFAVSLRHGPPGTGTLAFPIDVVALLQEAQRLSMSCLLDLRDQPSLLPEKLSVRWSRLVLQKGPNTY